MTATGEQDDGPRIEGQFGWFTITAGDRREVLGYRLSLLGLALSGGALLIQWGTGHGGSAWPWLAAMAACLGLALHWIHIYLRPLHRALQLFWLLGCLGGVALAWQVGPEAMLPALEHQPAWLWGVGPLFAALTGVGFKEFFCFRRPEAIGLTLLLPLALLGHLSGLMPARGSFACLALAALLLLVLALRKFPMDAAADIGDKSVFAHLASLRGGSTA